MKSSVLTLLILTITFSTAFSQWNDNHITLSHKITTEKKAITNFDKLEVGEDFEVIIKFSDKAESVEIEANENLHDYIVVEKVGNTLKIDTKSYSTGNYGKKNRGYEKGAKERLVAYITAKQLTEIEGEEDVTIELEDKLVGQSLKIDLDEDCVLEGHIEVQNLTVRLNEDSALDLEGSAQYMDLEANEDSLVKGYDFEVGDLNIELSGDSEAKLTVNGDIELRARGDSNFYYRGKGKITRQRLTGDSEVKYWE